MSVISGQTFVVPTGEQDTRMGNAPTTSMDGPKDTELKKAKKRVSIIMCIILMVFCVVAGVLVGWRLRVLDFSDHADAPLFLGRTLSLEVALVAVDGTAGTVTFDWFVINDSMCNETAQSTCAAVNIFFDLNIESHSDGPDTTLTNEHATLPIFHWNSSTYVAEDQHLNPALAAFRTPMSLMSAAGAGSLQDYPFDVYTTGLYLFAQESETNTTVGVHVTRTRGIAVGFSVVTRAADAVTPPGVLNTVVIVYRGVLVKAYAILIVTAVWVITLIFVFATFHGVICGYAQHIEVMVIPVATLFTITQVRTTMPGAPAGFGAIIDYVGLLPCVAMMTFCGAVTIGALAVFDPTQDRETIVDRVCHYLGYGSKAKANRLLSSV